MPKAGLEPARLAAPPPQDGVSANSTTSARLISDAFTSFPASAAALPEPALLLLRLAVAAGGLLGRLLLLLLLLAVWRLHESRTSRRAAKS